MKSLYSLLLIFVLFACDKIKSTTKNDKLSRRDSAILVWNNIKPTLLASYDSLSKKTTYTDSISARLKNKTGLSCKFVIVQDSTLSSLYWDLQFRDNSPLLIKSYKFLIDEAEVDYTPKQIGFDYIPELKIFLENSTNVASTSNKTLPILEKIAISRLSKVRFIGRFYEESYTITDAEKKALAKMMKAHATYKAILGY